MQIQDFPGGGITLQLTSAHIPGALSAIREKGIELRDLRNAGDLTVSFQIRYSDLGKLSYLARRRGDALRVISHAGMFWRLLALLRRPVLLLGLAAILILTLWLPGRVLFVQVEGNQSVPARRIVEEASRYGLSFGSQTRQIRSERIKNALLSSLPELKWAGVNTYGCVAVITVKERELPDKAQTENTVSSIVAGSSGIVLSVTAEQGTPLCKPGDAVTAGQTLISGYTDGGICIRAGAAKGEVMALTRRSITMYYPEQLIQRTGEPDTDRKFALILGKKRINFYQGSGILPPSCARIYTEFFVTLPGGYTLPVCLVCEQWLTYRETQTCAAAEADLSASARQYLREQMPGEILQSAESVSQQDGFCILSGVYFCKEQIGITRIEETLQELWQE